MSTLVSTPGLGKITPSRECERGSNILRSYAAIAIPVHFWGKIIPTVPLVTGIQTARRAALAIRTILEAALLLNVSVLAAQTLLISNGISDPYAQTNQILGALPETPDCAHPAFGPHLIQAFDGALGKSVFVFTLHVVPDNDRCVAFDRQRMEIKVDTTSPPSLKAFLNESVTYRWRFKLPLGFQPSTSFTHIHQVKAGDGDANDPLITLSPGKGNPNVAPDVMRLSHSTGTGGITETIATVQLAPFIGAWVEAYEKITFNHTGKYSLVLRRMTDSAVLLSYTNENIDLWRTGTTFGRPKWGFYRSLIDMADLRDDQVRFDRFCLAKGNDDCPLRTGTDAVVSAANGTPAVSSESIVSFYGLGLTNDIATADMTPLPLTLGNVSVHVTDSAGVARPAPLFYVSPLQINFEIPSGTAAGPMTAAVVNLGTTMALAPANVAKVAPALFTADGTGKGVAAALAIHVAANGQQSVEPIFQCSNGSCFSVPIELGVDTPVFLTLFGTGIRNSPKNVSVTINGVNLVVQYAGAQGSFAGLDQVNVAVPLSLRGTGEADLVLSADGQFATPVRINIR